MDNVTFRLKSEPTKQEDVKIPVKTDGPQTIEINEEVPFTDYIQQHKHPFLVDHFKLGDAWQDKFGGFKDEIDTIEGYFRGKIELGEMQNDTKAVQEKFKEIYKLCKIDKTERTTMQLEKLAAYIRFLKDTDNIKVNHSKYAYS
jgi:hypothetical protein